MYIQSLETSGWLWKECFPSLAVPPLLGNVEAPGSSAVPWLVGTAPFSMPTFSRRQEIRQLAPAWTLFEQFAIPEAASFSS